MRPALAALACLYLAAHLAFLPDSLEDIDSVNFAMGVADFDVARHQPHPPGYPVFIALTKALASLLGGGADGVLNALTLASALAGAALVPLLFVFFRALGGADDRAWWAMGIAAACPLVWFTALRPLSDMTGLAAALGAQALIVAALTRRTEAHRARLLFAGAFVAGVAAGVRAQTVMLTVPLLLAAVVLPFRAIDARARLGALVAAAAGATVWLVPLLAASGGLEGYLTALGTQAGEDFSGVVMLWTSRSPRVAADAVVYSFLWPWGGLVAGGLAVGLAAAGVVRLLLTRELGALLWLGVAFGPYAIFHLLFHETVTVRYALPLVIPVAFLMATAFSWGGPRLLTIFGTVSVGVCLATALPASRVYGASEAPAFRAMRKAADAAPVLGMHAVFKRTAEWASPSAEVLRAPHGREWLALVERWRADQSVRIAFVSDPRRTDLALFDPQSRELDEACLWGFPSLPFVGGVRPGNVESFLMRPPGWMLDRGWALSAEIGGVSAREDAGPHLRPSVAWIRARAEGALLMIGGRNLDRAPTTIVLSRGDAELARWPTAPGFFFHLLPTRPGSLAGEGYVPLHVRAEAGAESVGVSLEQFDLQPDGVVMRGFSEGWHEPEYNPSTARAWRWMSDRGVLWVRPVGRDVTLALSGESPLRYFGSPPTLTVSVAGAELDRFTPSQDFTREVRLPAALLEKAAGEVAITSDLSFVPAERGGSADPRRLGLRIYDVAVR